MAALDVADIQMDKDGMVTLTFEAGEYTEEVMKLTLSLDQIKFIAEWYSQNKTK